MRAFCLLFLSVCFLFGAAASAQTLTCSSDDMGRHYCRANTSNGVQLVHQRSGSPCTMGVSWGYDSGGIWVDHGCRADFALGGQSQSSPNDAMRACKNTAGERLPSVPLAYISVYRGTDTGDGNYMINFRAQPPGGRPSSGFCIVSRNGRVERFQFDPGSGGNTGGGNYGGGGGNYGGGMSPNDAMNFCKNTASQRLPTIPLAYISVYRGSNTGNGSYMINFHAQPPNGPQSSGFCIIASNGRLENFQFDPGSGNGGGNSGGQTAVDVMRACKNAVSGRLPNVPLAYISVNQPRVNGGSMLATFRVQPPNGAYSSGSCDVFKNGRVNLQFDR